MDTGKSILDQVLQFGNNLIDLLFIILIIIMKFNQLYRDILCWKLPQKDTLWNSNLWNYLFGFNHCFCICYENTKGSSSTTRIKKSKLNGLINILLKIHDDHIIIIILLLIGRYFFFPSNLGSFQTREFPSILFSLFTITFINCFFF